MNEKSLGFPRLAFTSFFAVAVLISAIVPSVRAEDTQVRIVRLSFVEGDVRYHRPDGLWEAAVLNLPIQQGFGLQTADGYAEVEFGNGLVVRLANDTSLEFTVLALEDGRLVTRLDLSQGTALINAKLSHNEELSITASDLNLEVPRSGRFRIETSPTESWITVSHGKVDVESGAGAPTELDAGHALHEIGGDLRSCLR